VETAAVGNPEDGIGAKTMQVKQLIEELSSMPAEATVVFPDYGATIAECAYPYEVSRVL